MAKSLPATVVRVLNPAPGGAGFMKRRKAERLEQRGWLRFSADRLQVKIIRFTDGEISAMNSEAMVDRGYDHDTATVIARRQQVEGLPCVKPLLLITNPTVRTIYNKWHRNGAVKVLMQDGLPCIQTEAA